MTYKKHLVVAIRANNKILREENETVQIPFGSEYQVVLRNLNTVKAQVQVEIDGEDASGWLVLQPNSKVELERFIKNNNLSSGNRFRFIERSANIENHRGIGIEDGIVKITYKFEKKYTYLPPYTIIAPPVTVIHEHHYPNPYVNPNPWLGGVIDAGYTGWQSDNNWYTTNTTQATSQTITTSGSLQSQGTSGTIFAMNCSVASQQQPATKSGVLRSVSSTVTENTAGITVPGSESTQRFYPTYDFACDDPEVIILKLVGAFKNVKVTQPITVDYKPTCVTCGRVNRANNKFCSECGTALRII
jgi:hypothetical protein